MEYISAYGVIAFCLTVMNIMRVKFIKISSCAMKIFDFFQSLFYDVCVSSLFRSEVTVQLKSLNRYAIMHVAKFFFKFPFAPATGGVKKPHRYRLL